MAATPITLCCSLSRMPFAYLLWETCLDYPNWHCSPCHPIRPPDQPHLCAHQGRTRHGADLIGAGVGNVDDPCRLFGLQIGDEGSLEGLGLAHYVLLVTATGQSQQQTVICLHLGRMQLSVIRGLLTKRRGLSNPGDWVLKARKAPAPS